MKRRTNYKILALIVILTLGLLNGCGHKSAKKSSATTTDVYVSSSALSKASSDQKTSEDALTEKQEDSCSSVSEDTQTGSSENQTTQAMTPANDTVSGNTAPDSSIPGSTYNNPGSSGNTYSTTQPHTSNSNHSKSTSGSITPSGSNGSTTSNTYAPATASSTKPPAATTTVPQTTTAAATKNTTTEQQNAQINVTISISCSTAVNNPELKPGIFLPSDGIILSTCSVTVNKGDTVYAAFEKACSNAGIKYEFTGTVPMKSIYISSIAGLAQMDCGRYSGWKYSVNGKEPSVGCSMYTLSDGDVIDWHYTTTL